MPVTEQFTRETQVEFAKFNGRVSNIEKDIHDIDTQMKILTELRVDIGKLEMQIKVTWGLLTMVVGGLLSVAFSIWKN